MNDVDGYSCLLADLDSFTDGFQDLFAFRSNVSGVNAPVGLHHRGHFGELVGGVVRIGWDQQGCGETQGAVLHGLIHELLHLLQLVRCRVAAPIPQHTEANLGSPYVGAHVQGNTAGFQSIEVPAEGRPVDLQAKGPTCCGLTLDWAC